MTSSQTIKELDSARKAELLTENPVYIQAVTSIRQAIVDKWRACPVRDVEGQHELKLMLKLLDDLEANIKQVVDTGKLARLEIERENKLKRIFRRS